MTLNEKFEAVIGLEVHAQLLTRSKIFCGCSTLFGAEPNSQTCPICLGMPGVLPVLNKTAVEFAIKMGLATNCRIASRSKFARKNYFYPDLPKGYQISQYEQPLCENGWIDIEVADKIKRIGITRIHLEEDAGKSVHDEVYVDKDSTLIDLNRCGTPLIEIVSEPDFRSPAECSAYLNKLRKMVRYLGICDGNMEEGSLRCDANISIRPAGQKTLGTRTEIKNMNSFRNVEKALQFEVERQITILGQEETIEQSTLLWDANLNQAKIMRWKEEAHDYRYFPEPDLVPVVVSDKWIANIKEKLPEMPDIKQNRFMDEYKLPAYDAEILTSSLELADYFEEICKKIDHPKLVSNWIMGEVLKILNEKGIAIKEFSIPAQRLAELLDAVNKNVVSSSAAKKVFEYMLQSSESIDHIIEILGLKQLSDSSEIERIIEQIIMENKKEVEAYRAGKEKLFGFFIGQVMKASKGKANPHTVNQILKEKLK
jgi:aspartyl-tRNA(Asn)/glutamyl-tRNA(Gln) amidotransferase subunit B